jgi:hypothetical protein
MCMEKWIWNDIATHRRVEVFRRRAVLLTSAALMSRFHRISRAHHAEKRLAYRHMAVDTVFQTPQPGGCIRRNHTNEPFFRSRYHSSTCRKKFALPMVLVTTARVTYIDDNVPMSFMYIQGTEYILKRTNRRVGRHVWFHTLYTRIVMIVCSK